MSELTNALLMLVKLTFTVIKTIVILAIQLLTALVNLIVQSTEGARENLEGFVSKVEARAKQLTDDLTEDEDEQAPTSLIVP